MNEYDRQGYFRDLFIDGGVSLTSRGNLPAANRTGFTLTRDNYVGESTSDQNNKIVGNSNDLNGALLYPDGMPRFRTVFVNGGRSYLHGESLGEAGRERYRDFYYNGGSYTGSCAGMFFSGHHRDARRDKAYLHIWPGYANPTKIYKTRTDMSVPSNSWLLNYYDFGGDGVIAGVFHNGGGYADTLPGQTQVLARFLNTPQNIALNEPSVWAYKEDEQSGRLVVTGSHPEGVSSGEKMDLMSAMLMYALDGVGNKKPVKGALSNNKTVRMDGTNEKIGDKQYHYYTFCLPEGISSVRIDLESNSGHDLDLYLRHSSKSPAKPVALNGYYDLSSTGSGANESIRVTNPVSGTWYVGVFGDSARLNGEPYSLRASWDAGAGEPAEGMCEVVDILLPDDSEPTQEPTELPPTEPTATPTPEPSNVKAGYIHPGIDIAPSSKERNTNYVYSTHAGFVTYAGPAPAEIAEKGWLIQIESDMNRDNVPDIITRYNHLLEDTLLLNDFKYKRINYTPECFLDLSTCLNGTAGPIEKLPYGYGPYVARNQVLGRMGDSGSPGHQHVQYEIVTNRYIDTYSVGLDSHSCQDNPYTEACTTDNSRPGFFFPINRQLNSTVRGPVYINPGFTTPIPALTPITFD